VTGFRFALVLENGERADPAVFPTTIPTWRVGDEFLAGAELQRFRIVAIQPGAGEDGEFDAVWVVEPLSSSPASDAANARRADRHARRVRTRDRLRWLGRGLLWSPWPKKPRRR
jgi:hypothetical protein